MSEYGIQSITTHRGLDIVLNRPSFFLYDCETKGLVQLAVEITDNCIDEIQRLGDKGELTIILCNDVKNSTYHHIIYDNGRGIPVDTTKNGIDTFLRALTEPHSSGKFKPTTTKSNAYGGNAIGQMGVGSKVVGGTSEYNTTISIVKNAIAKLNIHNAKHGEPIVLAAKNKITGSYTCFKPSKDIFTGIETYTTDGYPLLIERLQKYCVFKNFNIKFYMYEGSPPLKLYTTKDPNEALDIIHEIQSKSVIDWDSATFDPNAWLRKYWRIREPYQFYTEDSIKVKEDKLSFVEFKLGFSPNEKTGNVFGVINNQHINNSDHITVFIDCLKKHISNFITNKDKLNFFLNSYRLPLFIAVDVVYSGAEFTSATKDKFKSSAFRTVYNEVLNKWFTDTKTSFIEVLFKEMSSNIDEMYLESLSDTGVSKNRNRLSGSLNFPNKFKDCECKDKKIIEVFLTEGESASGAIGYDKRTKALYMLKGKPKNCVKGVTDTQTAIKQVYNNKIYADILTVLGYDLAKRDMSALNFSKVILMVDADTHGAHIASLILGTFQLVAPELIDAGIFYKALPPFYRILRKSGNKVSKTNAVYANSVGEVVEWKVKNLYHSRLSIIIRDESGKVVSPDTLVEYTKNAIKIEEIGTAIANLSKELSVDPEILELFCAYGRDLNIATLDMNRLHRVLRTDRVNYDSEYDQLQISYDDKDIIVTLQIIVEKLHSVMFPLFDKLNWGNWYIELTSLKDNKFNNTKVGIYELYMILLKISNNVKIDILKGLGSMSQEDIAVTCMNDLTRNIQQVNLADNYETVLKLLGNDSDVRKDLLPEPRSTI